MGTVSTNKGDFIFQSIDDTIKFVQTAAREKATYGSEGIMSTPAWQSVPMGSTHQKIFRYL